LVVILIWAGSIIFIRLALNEVPPVALALARFAVATLVLVGFSLYQMRRRRALTSALHKDPFLFAVLGLTGVTFLYVTQFYSLALISPTAGSIIINLHVFFAMLLSSLSIPPVSFACSYMVCYVQLRFSLRACFSDISDEWA
jgi:drug/metabolite transporter (DMT)-like permease